MRSEIEFLLAAKGVEGAVQMISSKDRLAETSVYRPPALAARDFEPRTKSRIVMLLYGKALEDFETRVQSIGALRDAMKGTPSLTSIEIRR